jgi:Asp/Glu/hydantoin racemase
MKIWYQSLAPIRSLPNYTAALAAHALEACGESTTIRFNGVNEARYGGRMPAEVHRYPYAKLMLQKDSIEFAIDAEREGFDAFVIGSFSEPFLQETRSVLEVPVVSLAEASMLAACSLGEQFALVSLSPSYARRLRGVVRRHGLEARLSGAYSLQTHRDEAAVDREFAAPDELIADFTAVAQRAIDEGADVVIPAEGLLSEVLYAQGVRSIASAAILDCVGLTLLNAGMMIQARARLKQTVSRRWSYQRPDAGLINELRGR